MYSRKVKSKKRNFAIFGLAFLILSKILLSPGWLFAQQGNASQLPSSASSPPPSQATVEGYFECLNLCSESLPLEDYFNCLHDCSYSVKHLERKIPEKLIDETLAERTTMDKMFDGIIQERLDCYTQTASIHLRLRSCRKKYIRQVMKLAKQINRAIRATRRFKHKRGHRELGRFVICVQDCPISLALCRGKIAMGVYKGTCDHKEVECLEQCFLDHYL